MKNFLNGKGRICVIDDDEDLLEVICNTLKSRNFNVRGFNGAEEALKFLAEKTEPKVEGDEMPAPEQIFDVYVCDLRMPKLDGIKFLEIIREKKIETPVILMTAYSSMNTAIDALRAGAFDFVIKPLNFDHLEISVNKALRLRKVEQENRDLRAVINPTSSENVIAQSAEMKKLLTFVKRIAPSNANILITGESGTGKEVVARAIHRHSRRSKGPFVAVNCAAIPENLLESEFFGYARGAFTGAQDTKVGLFEEANGGTLLLDEIGDLPMQLQSKLLRVIQERKIRRLGETKSRNIDVRIVAASLRDLKADVKDKRFREDLFFRLNVILIEIPPLRDRKDDILPMAKMFLDRYKLANQATVESFGREAIKKLMEYKWPGNVRELENVVERAVILATKDTIEPEDLPEFSSEVSGDFDFNSIFDSSVDLPSLDDMVNRYINHVVKCCGGIKEKAAQVLGVDRKTIYRRLQTDRDTAGMVN